MKFCPECGKELGRGVTRCWNKECNLVLTEPNDPDTPLKPLPLTTKLRENQYKLEHLHLEYDLARAGLGKGKTALPIVVLSIMFICLLGVFAPFLFNGWQIVSMVGIAAATLFLYHALVFGRAAKIKGEINKEKKRIEIELGKSIR